MLKLLEILQNIYLDKLLFKSTEFKAGFERAINMVKIHGFQTEVIQETKQLRSDLEQARRDIEFLRERLELKKEAVKALNQKNGNLKSLLHNSSEKGTKKSVKRLKLITKTLTNTNKTADEKVYGVLAYLKSIKENSDSEDGQSS